eukprot:CAMPEP_0185731068 /NCGR_PEP_ID=MMETSP1171-20130828/11789_1 /TAXON_ID=374046 /ORGANISM="Helicotheca tamensis, Strain CCMP826" /LENGTH=445 /DNA_ID=CAMNT_0028400251 /DNA_START=58 /DNA_END=1395 /DNA_ORIENTATION=-
MAPSERNSLSDESLINVALHSQFDQNGKHTLKDKMTPPKVPNASLRRVESLPVMTPKNTHRCRRSPSSSGRHSDSEERQHPTSVKHHRQSSSSSSMAYDDNTLEELWENLRKRKQILGDSHPNVGLTYNHIGNCFFRRDELEAALTAYTAALNVYKNSFGIKTREFHDDPKCSDGSSADGSSSDTSIEYANYPIIALCMCNIGTVQWRTGDLNKAIHSLEESVRIYCRFCSKKDQKPMNMPELSTAWYNLGIAYCLRADFGEALEAFEMARIGFAHSHGPNHVEVARVMEAMGNVYSLRGEIERAIDCHRLALKIKVPELGNSHPSVLCTKMSIAAANRKMLRFDDARSTYIDVLNWQRTNLSKARKAGGGNGKWAKSIVVDIGQTLHFLALVHKEIGALTQAMKYCKEGLEAYAEAELASFDNRLVMLSKTYHDLSRSRIHVSE